MKEVGLDVLDRVDTGDVDAEEPLEIVSGVRAGDGVNTDGPDGGEVGGDVGVGDVPVPVNDGWPCPCPGDPGPAETIGISRTLSDGRVI